MARGREGNAGRDRTPTASVRAFRVLSRERLIRRNSRYNVAVFLETTAFLGRSLERYFPSKS